MFQIGIPRESLKFTEARPRLSELLNRVYKREARVVIRKGNIPVAALVSISDLEWLELRDKERSDAFSTILSAAKEFADESPERIEAEIARALTEVRASSESKVASPR